MIVCILLYSKKQNFNNEIDMILYCSIYIYISVLEVFHLYRNLASTRSSTYNLSLTHIEGVEDVEIF